LRKDYLKSIMDVTSEIEERGGQANAVVVTKLFSGGVLAGNKLKASMSDTLSLAKSYTKFLHLDEVYNWQLGIEIIDKVESEISKRSRGLSAFERDRITSEVIRNRFGEKFAPRAELIYKTAKSGRGYIFAASDFAELYTKGEEGSKRAMSINLDMVKYGTDSMGIKLLTESGMKQEEAMLAVIAIKSGDMNILNEDQKAVLTGSGYQKAIESGFADTQNLILSGAKSVFGNITSGITQVVGNPLTKLAAGLALMAWSYRREIKDALGISRRWSSLALSYMRWAGKESVGKVQGILSALRPSGGGLKKAAFLAAAGTVAAAGLTYGVRKVIETDWSQKPKSTTDQAQKMVSESGQNLNSSASKEIANYAASSRGKVDPGKVGSIMEKSTGLDRSTDRVASSITRERSTAREKVAKESIIRAMGGNIIETPSGVQRVEITVPGYVASTLS
jgi:hypothetical protein